MKTRDVLSSRLAVLMLLSIACLMFGCSDEGDTDPMTVSDAGIDAMPASDGEMSGPDGMQGGGDAEASQSDAELALTDVGPELADTSVMSPDADIDLSDGSVNVPDMMELAADLSVGGGDASMEGTPDSMVDAPDTSSPPTNQMRFAGCRLNDTWSIEIQAIPLPGQGCQDGGGVALGDQTHVFEVIQGEGERLSLLLMVPATQAEYQVIEAEFFEEDDQCRLIASMENGFYFPNDQMADGLTTQVVLRFDYDMSVDQNGMITGTGLSTDRYQAFPDENNLEQDTAVVVRACTEPLRLSGQVTQ
ncbi:MAG: hypothetical protein ACPGQS_09160 [Bradymonadia bacterium]